MGSTNQRLFIGWISKHELGVAQAAIHRKGLRRSAAKRVWIHGVGGVAREANVLNEVNRGNHRQHPLAGKRIVPLVIPYILTIRIQLQIKELNSLSIKGMLTMETHVLQSLPTPHAQVEMIPSPFPCCPSPAPTKVTREIVARTRRGIRQKIETADLANTLIVAKSLQQKRAVTKKRGRWEAIIFEDDRFILFGKNPIDCITHSNATTQVVIAH